MCIATGKLITRLMHPTFESLVSESVITDWQWHHVGLVYDYDGLKRCLNVDGAKVAKDADVVGGVGSDGGLYLVPVKCLMQAVSSPALLTTFASTAGR